MKDLNICIIQSNIVWENIDENLSLFEVHIDNVVNADLIVLPEMFTTGFSMNTSKLAESMEGKTMAWLRDIAKRKNCVISGSIIIEEDDKYYNRLIWMRPDGTFGKYDKRHLFRMSEEHQTFTGGNERVVFEVKGWRVLPLICYDLRFPVWSRNRNDYDVLIYVANWPEARRTPWQIMLKSRAIENQAYVIAVNRLGKDEMGNSYSGDSAVIEPKGNVISKTLMGEESVETVSLSYDDLEKFRKKFPVGLDGDDFRIT